MLAALAVVAASCSTGTSPLSEAKAFLATSTSTTASTTMSPDRSTKGNTVPTPSAEGFQPPPIVKVISFGWTDGWWADLNDQIAPVLQVTGAFGQEPKWVFEGDRFSIFWNPIDTSARFIENVSDIRTFSGSNIAVGNQASCQLARLSRCAWGSSPVMVDTDTGEIQPIEVGVPYDLYNPISLWMTDGGSWGWTESMPDTAPTTVDWSDGRTTEILPLELKPTSSNSATPSDRIEAVGSFGMVALRPAAVGAVPPRSQVEVKTTGGESFVALANGGPQCTGGLAFGIDDATLLVGTIDGLRIIDTSDWSVTADSIRCGDNLQLRSNSNAVEVSPGEWLVARAPANNVSGDPVLVDLINVATATCDRVAQLVDVPWVTEHFIVGVPGSQTVVLRLVEIYSTKREYHVMLDLSRRFPGAMLTYADLKWSAG